jgi:EAL domain-containing protein (putative c-di-GMP-specific phosphodiesterase class I)
MGQSRAVESGAAARQAIEHLLNAARVALDMDLAFLSHLQDGTQEFQFVVDPAHVFDLQSGTVTAADDAYCARMLRGDIGNAVGDVRADPALAALPVTQQLGVGAYCGVPVRLLDGRLYGTLCGLDSESHAKLSDDQVTVLRVISALVSQQLGVLDDERREVDIRSRSLLRLIEPDALTMVAQPITDAVTGQVVGYEALARFSRSEAGPVRPDLVFAEAAELGLGLRFEYAALAAALGLLPSLPTHCYLSVNLSAAAAASPECTRLLASAPLDRLVLELTEHDAVEDYQVVLGTLTSLRAAGLRLAIDDVGAGFASLRHILRLEPDIIKLDLSLTRAVDADPARRALVASLVGFAQELGITLVGEGVETEPQRQALLQLGVRFMQGYLMGRPAPLFATSSSQAELA